MTIALAPVLDTPAASALRTAMKRALKRGKTVSLDGSAVEQVGLACLQVLVATQAAADSAQIDFRIEQPSAALVTMTTLVGLGGLVSA